MSNKRNVNEILDKATDLLNPYEFKGNLLSNPEVAFSFKPMSVVQLKKVLMHIKDEEEVEKLLDETLKENVQIAGNSCDPMTLYSEDRFWILYNMRLKSRGETLETTFRCRNPKCGQPTVSNIDLTSFSITSGSPKGYDTVQLSERVGLDMDFVRREDIIEFAEWSKVREENSEDKPNIDQDAEGQQVQKESTEDVDEIEKGIDYALGLYALMIQKIILKPESLESPPSHIEPKPIEEITDLSLDDRIKFIERLNEIDYNKIKEWYDANWFGVSLKKKVKCPICQHEEEEVLNLGNFF